MAAVIYPLSAATLVVSQKADLTGYCPCCQKEESTTFDPTDPFALSDAKSELVRRHNGRRNRRRHQCKGLMIFS